MSAMDHLLDHQFLFHSANRPKVHTIKVDGTSQSLRKELAVVTRQRYFSFNYKEFQRYLRDEIGKNDSSVCGFITR